MNPTATKFGPEFIEQMIDLLFKSAEKGAELAIGLLWSLLMGVLKAYWPIILGAVFILLVIGTAKAMMGRWGLLGTVLYNSLYGFTLLVIGLIWGPNVFIGDAFDLARTIIIYPVCYFVTGLVLKIFKGR